jgi:PAS domain S-box-containing protein
MNRPHDTRLLKEEVSAVRDRALTIQQELDGELEEQSLPVLQLFQELNTTIEELDVAAEELYQSQETLLETRAQVEAERLRYQELFEFAPDGYLVTDRVGVITEANCAAVELLGGSRAFLAPMPLATFVPEKDRPAFRQRLTALNADRSDDSVQEWEMALRSLNGAPFDAALRVSAVRGKDGSTRSIRWMVRDVSRQKRAEAQLRNLHAELEQRVDERTSELVRANKTAERLNDQLKESVRETNHRVKNNLQIISAMIDMRLADRQEAVTPADLRHLATQISLLANVHDLLTQSVAGGAPAVLSAQEMFTRMLAIVRNSAAPRQVQCRGQDFRLPLKAMTSLALIVNELVANAIKHGQGDVSVTIGTKDHRAVIEVLDSGPGFPEGFDPRAAANTGLELVQNLTSWDLNGAVSYGRGSAGGGKVELQFPLPQWPGDGSSLAPF